MAIIWVGEGYGRIGLVDLSVTRGASLGVMGGEGV